MSKLKTWKLWLFAGVCFLLVGIIHLIENRYSSGTMFIFLGGVYFVLSMVNYKVDKKIGKVGRQHTVSDDIESELRNLIAEGKEIKAIKKYRMVTGVGLKEAKEYVDNMK